MIRTSIYPQQHLLYESESVHIWPAKPHRKKSDKHFFCPKDNEFYARIFCCCCFDHRIKISEFYVMYIFRWEYFLCASKYCCDVHYGCLPRFFLNNIDYLFCCIKIQNEWWWWWSSALLESHSFIKKNFFLHLNKCLTNWKLMTQTIWNGVLKMKNYTISFLLLFLLQGVCI